MTLKPTEVSPASIQARGARQIGRKPHKKMVIDCKNDSHWRAIHDPMVNGVVLRRQPVKAMESFLDSAPKSVFGPHEFVCAQSRMRSELNKHLVLANEDEELRRKFLVNDIANWVRIFVQQSRSRNMRFCINSGVPSEFNCDSGSLKMILTYRGMDVTFRQPKDKDERSFKPYGVAMFRGQAYEAPVEWYGTTSSERAFYLTVEPASGVRRR